MLAVCLRRIYTRPIKEAEPLTKVNGYRGLENRARHYELLPRYLEGFLVYGDAAYALNPIYARGMTVVAMGSVALDNSLRSQLNKRQADKIVGLAELFQRQLSKITARLWKTIAAQDRRWPSAKVTEVQPSATRHSHKPSLQPVQSRPSTMARLAA
jgi:hypothetical protein